MSYSVSVRAWQITSAPGGWLRLTPGQISNGVFTEGANRQPVIYLRVVKGADGVRSISEAAMSNPGPIGAAAWRDVPFEMAMLFARDIEKQAAPSPLQALGEMAWENERTFVLGPMGTAGEKLRALKPPARSLDEPFLADIAAAYCELVAAKQNPAPAIAEQTGAPVGTARRWIAEARKHGHLPPATRGRAG